MNIEPQSFHSKNDEEWEMYAIKTLKDNKIDSFGNAIANNIRTRVTTVLLDYITHIYDNEFNIDNIITDLRKIYIGHIANYKYRLAIYASITEKDTYDESMKDIISENIWAIIKCCHTKSLAVRRIMKALCSEYHNVYYLIKTHTKVVGSCADHIYYYEKIVNNYTKVVENCVIRYITSLGDKLPYILKNELVELYLFMNTDQSSTLFQLRDLRYVIAEYLMYL